MTFPSPKDPAQSPVWDNYVVAQTVAAALGRIPRQALALGVQVQGSHVHLHFRLTELTGEGRQDIAHIADALETLVGDDVEVTDSYEVTDQIRLSPFDGVRWIFCAHVDNDET